MADDWRGPNAALIGRPGSRAGLQTPALVLDLDILHVNISSMAAHAESNGYLLRPCAKIHKSVEVARRQIDAGAIGMCCATLAEAEAMVAGGIPGVLLFTSVVTEPNLQRLATLNTHAKDLIVAVDDFDNVSALEMAVGRTGCPIQLLVDFDIGGGRTGVADQDAAIALARRISESETLQFAGVQAYNGLDLCIVDYETRRTAFLRHLQALSELLDKLRGEGLRPRIVSGGGTGSHDIDPELGVLTESQVGTYVFMDVNYLAVHLRRHESQPFRPALAVHSTVVSTAQRGFVITDVGVKEIDGAYGPIPPVLDGPWTAGRYTFVGDDLGRIDYAGGAEQLRVGSKIELLPPRCFQTVPLYSVYHCVSGDELVDIWPIQARQNW